MRALVLAGAQEAGILAERFRARVARGLLESGIDEDDRAVGLGDHDGVGGLLDGARQALDQGRGALARSDVEVGDDGAALLAGVVAPGPAVDRQPGGDQGATGSRGL